MIINYKIHDVTPREAKNFIVNYGINPYDECPCHSGYKFKFCCMLKPTAISTEKDLKRWLGKTNGDIWNYNDIKNPVCCYNGCTEESIGSHAIQKNRYLSMISDANQNVFRYICMFRNGKMSPYLKKESINEATTFYGFCQPHDSEIFKIIEGSKPITFSIEQKYALVYRSLSYAYNKLYRIRNYQIKEHFKNQPIIFANKPQNNILYLQYKFILLYHAYEKRLKDLRNLMNVLEENYSSQYKTWNIVNDFLTFTPIKTILTSNHSMVFHTTRLHKEYKKYSPSSLDFLNNEQNNYFTCIVLPQENSKNHLVFLAANKLADKRLSVDFFNRIELANDTELRNVINNIIFNSLEEFYFSRDYHDNLLSKNEQLDLREIVKEFNGIGSPAIDLHNINEKPKVDLFK
ncbi:hypothetical protein H1S01_17845 [Heliobacterium chlorum]|uniref:SEC-C domain-containing protein n=1 Tax=Heliobacterium chlorum TaxID=2698 RepID=A0ABR7T8I0_HELCL|nr:SEC-C domain-containing protein [Heliobacterium chlorum]MBC9786325.1 hypothetical protein [Heliobacterium chlorum]